MSDSNPTVFVIDDDVTVRESLKLLIDSAGWRAEAFGSGREFLSRPPLSGPSCLLLDVFLPDLHGLELQRLLADRIDMPIIFITGNDDVPTIVRAMKSGAVEFLTKPLHDHALLSAIGSALESSSAALMQATEIRHLRDRYASLSRREQEVMGLIVRGLLNKQVGGELDISEITVKAHRGKVMRKMKARSLAELVLMAARLCLTPLQVGSGAIDARHSVQAPTPHRAQSGFAVAASA
jgi:FixJ family two-component response regulator